MILQKLSSNIIGTFFAITLLIPPNFGINLFGLNFEDIPLIIIFVILGYKKVQTKKIYHFDKIFLIFISIFIVYTNIFTKEFELFNKTNLRFYFYFLIAYLIIDFLNESMTKILDIFEPLSLVMFVNFLIIIFQFQIPGSINGWILNNTGSMNPFTSGRLGGIQGGGPNVIGIICAIYSLICINKLLNSQDYLKYFVNFKLQSFFLFISLFNLYFTYSRGSYLSLLIGIIFIINFKDNLNKRFKVLVNISIIFITLVSIFTFPSIFLKQSNRSYLNQLGLQNVELFNGVGGGNYIKNVYKDFLIELDDMELKERFNITYSSKEKINHKVVEESNNSNQYVSGYLKLDFDYRDGILPKSKISFYFSNDGINWNQIGSHHTTGYVIELIKNDSFFEVGGWGDGQSPGGQYLDGYIEYVNIKTENFDSIYNLKEEQKGNDFFVYTTKFMNLYEGSLEYKNNILKLERPRNYWIAIPNDVDLTSNDFQIILKLELDSIPKGHETLFSQSSILRVKEDFNDQSWRWSIIDGRMYFFWIENVEFGYAHSLGGMSLRSSKLISNNGNFDSVISEFTTSQYDEITTSHNGFLTMSVEYGLALISIIVLLIFYAISKNFKQEYKLEIGIFLMLFSQNLTNDLVYAPDVAIYFWIIPIFFASNILRVKD
tara:strand:+ start:479 stop:2455 length:1977 start_codon:yes stop_codon:yes gene_type:complete